MKNIFALALLAISITLVSCDFLTPQKSLRVAVGKGDFTYAYMASHLKDLLEKNDFKISIVQVANALEANAAVARGEADLTFVMNSSTFIPEFVGRESGNLRIVAPLADRLFLLFAKGNRTRTGSTRDRLRSARVGVEVLGGEVSTQLKNMLEAGRFDSVTIVGLPRPVMELKNMEEAGDIDFIQIWGTSYGPRTRKLLADGWTQVSIDESWIEFYTLNEPLIFPFTLPALPGIPGSTDINTLSVGTHLVVRTDVGETAVYELTKILFEHRLELMSFDPMYRSIKEEAPTVSQMLYPLHPGADAYFRRNEPSFLVRYADAIALIFSFGALMYGATQTLRNRMMRRRKERLDLYFLEFSEIRSLKLANSEKQMRLDALLQRALAQMTNEKLEKGDFHILARLVQQEMSNLK